MASFPVYSVMPQRRRPAARRVPTPTVVVKTAPTPRQKVVSKVKNLKNSIKNSAIKKKISFSLMSYFNFVCSIFSNITILSFYLCAVVLVYNYTSAPDNSFLYKMVTRIVEVIHALKEYKCTILWFILAYIPFAPVIISVRENRRLPTALAIYAYIIIVPERTVFEYLVQSLALVLVVRSKDKNFRLLSIIIFFIVYFCQFALPTGNTVNTHDCVSQLFTHTDDNLKSSSSLHVVTHPHVHKPKKHRTPPVSAETTG